MAAKFGNDHVGRYLDLGFQFAVAIVVGAGGGYWLDSRIGTMPLFLIVGVLLGGTSGFLSLYRAVYPRESPGDKKDAG